MKIELEISSIRVLRKRFSDEICVNFVGPAQYPVLPISGQAPFKYYSSLRTEVAKGYGAEYVFSVFGVVPEIILLD